MSFRILCGDKGFVDFSSPVEVTEKEKERFIILLKSIFDSSIIEEKNVQGFRDWRVGDKKLYPRYWSAEEYAVMLGSDTLDEAITKLGRSGMAVLVQDGKWRPDYDLWCKKKGKDPFGKDMILTIKEFMKERKDKVIGRRQTRKKIRQIKKNIEELKEELASLGSQKNRDRIQCLINLKQIEERHVEDYIRKEKAKIFKEIDSLKEELERITED